MKEKTSFFKWMALFVLVFTLSLPVTAKESFAGTMYSVSEVRDTLHYAQPRRMTAATRSENCIQEIP